MAFYDDGYMWPQEHTTYDPVDYQDSVSFSGYEPYGLDTYGYVHNSYSCAYPEINYFAYNYVEPKLITYESDPCVTGYVSSHTQYSISYSKIDSGFNEPEFEEYDPTPYGGGYDIISVYGKPLPPSDRTCYPRSNQKHIEPVCSPIPLVEAKLEPEHEPESRPEPQPVHVPVVMPQPIPVPAPVSLVELEPKPEPEPELESEYALVPIPDPLELGELGERERDEYSYPDYGYDYPWPEYDNGNRIGVGYDYGYGKQVVQIPPFEYDPDVVDLCENIFGNWPCLARIRNQQMGVDNKPRITCPDIGHQSHHNPLEDCANYIFGRPISSYNQYQHDHGYAD